MAGRLNTGVRPALRALADRWRVIRARRELDPLLRHWGDCYRINKSLGGQGRSTWLVDNRGEQFIFRAAGGMYEILALQHLASRSVPYRFPQLIPTMAGATHVLSPAGRQWTLYRLVAGEPPPPCKSLELVGEIGRLAATVNALLVGVDLPAYEGDFRLKLFELRGSPAGATAGGGPLPTRYPALLPAALAWHSARREDNLRHVADLPSQTVYDDFHDNNMLCQGGKLTGLIDFDSLAHGPRAIDFCSALLYLLTEPAHRQADHVRALRNGFHSVVPLGEAEYRLVPQLMADRLLVMVERLLGEGRLPRHRAQLAERLIDLLGWVITENDLADRLASPN
jgi:Ser/Thr protein kinase RdoA (MazF antagonist)